MNERPTPETDAARHDLSDYGSPVLCSWGDWVDADFARKLERERDEAREKYDNLATEHMLAINKLCNERDEAREMAQQLIHIASHCLGWHDNTNPETITEAIKRWNAATKK